jgi:hypothetical protein
MRKCMRGIEKAGLNLVHAKKSLVKHTRYEYKYMRTAQSCIDQCFEPVEIVLEHIRLRVTTDVICDFLTDAASREHFASRELCQQTRNRWCFFRVQISRQAPPQKVKV